MNNHIVKFFVLLVVGAVFLKVGSLTHRSSRVGFLRPLSRRLVTLDPRSIDSKPSTTNATIFNENFDDFLKQEYQPEQEEFTYKLDNEWCRPPELPPINYENCNKEDVFNKIPIFGGLTNALKFLLLSAIRSIEDGEKCFFIDERQSHFPKHFFESLFEPIGLNEKSDMVRRATTHPRHPHTLHWYAVWNNLEKRRVENSVNNIDALNYENVEGHDLKRNMLKRIWRPLPEIRHKSCKKLEEYVQDEDYIAISMREGDKETEGFIFATAQQYIDKITEVASEHFGGQVPLIFAATDTCDPVKRLRKLKPEWSIVSECDRVDQQGFLLRDHFKWTSGELRQHYEKFFIELFAMAGAKVWIGVSYTNVSWVSNYGKECISLISLLIFKTILNSGFTS